MFYCVVADDFILNIDSEKDGDSDTLSNLTPRKQIIKKKVYSCLHPNANGDCNCESLIYFFTLLSDGY